jgi:hypothetical protein
MDPDQKGAISVISTIAKVPAVVGYPRLARISSEPGIIVLLHASNSGTVVFAERGSGYEVGYYSRNWSYGEIQPCHEAVTLVNES